MAAWELAPDFWNESSHFRKLYRLKNFCDDWSHFLKLDRLKDFCVICQNFNLSWECFHFPLRIFAINFLHSYFFFIDRDLFHCLAAKNLRFSYVRLFELRTWDVWLRFGGSVESHWRMSIELLLSFGGQEYFYDMRPWEREGGCYGYSEPIKIASSFF